MRRLIPSLLALPLLTLAACSFGYAPAGHPLALNPAGADVSVYLRTTRIRGELLAADSAGVVVLDSARIVRILPAAVQAIAIAGGPTIYVDKRPQAYRGLHARMALWSRYPQGIDRALERTLLDAYELAAVAEVGE